MGEWLVRFWSPRTQKWIKRIKVFYEGTDGDLLVNYKGDESDIDDSFTIDLSIDPDEEDLYTGSGIYKVYTYYTPGNTDDEPSSISQFFKFNISEGEATVWSISRIEVMFVVEELY